MRNTHAANSTQQRADHIQCNVIPEFPLAKCKRQKWLATSSVNRHQHGCDLKHEQIPRTL